MNEKLIKLEQLLNDYDETLFNKDGSHKNIHNGLESISNAFNRMLDEEKDEIIKLMLN